MLYWPQLVLFEQKNSVRLRNALLFTLKYSLPVLGAAALQLVAWLLMVLFAPWTLLLLPVAAVWFIPYAALFVLYDDWGGSVPPRRTDRRTVPRPTRAPGLNVPRP